MHVIFSSHKYMQVWSILDLHYLNICSSIYWHLCDICSTQAEEQGMELWHKSGDLVCWFVLWLRYHSSSFPVCNPQILLCTCGPCATVLSIWVFLVCLYSGLGKLLFFIADKKEVVLLHFSAFNFKETWNMTFSLYCILKSLTPFVLCSVCPLCHWIYLDGWLQVWPGSCLRHLWHLTSGHISNQLVKGGSWLLLAFFCYSWL